jgi:predicted nucleic acid-binding protein
VITVSNTTPIISLSAIGKIEILRDIFEEVIIPKAVYDEIKSKHDGYGYNEVDLTFIKVETVKNTELVPLFLSLLDTGEAETIALSKELGADNTIIDENIGYGVAKETGLNVIRTLSILLKAKETGIVTEVKPLIDEMVIKGRWYSNRVYRSFLSRANEL